MTDPYQSQRSGGSSGAWGQPAPSDTCPGAESVAVAHIGFGSMIGGFFIGLGLPILLGLAGLILLISGLIARSRSKQGA